jgi:NAD(P)-dependent dehydrogenase (short-subunit alcohol dehydrogenase family)
MLALDVGSDESVQRCVDEVVAREGRVDVLVNNAGAGLSGALEDTSIEEAAWQMDTNLLGVLRMTRAVLPVMRQQGSGRIITISSLAGLTGMAYQPVYAASKHAVEGLMSSLRLELADSPIDACTVAPGDFRTGFTSARTVARGAASGVHADRFARTMAIYERDEEDGPDPGLVGDLVVRVVGARRLRPRYLVGKPSQRWALLTKGFMPASAFEYVTTRIYGLR